MKYRCFSQPVDLVGCLLLAQAYARVWSPPSGKPASQPSGGSIQPSILGLSVWMTPSSETCTLFFSQAFIPRRCSTTFLSCGLVRSLPFGYLLTLKPRKSKPSFKLTIFVLSGLRESPLSARKVLILGRT